MKRQEELNKKLMSLTLMDVYENQGYVYNDKLKAYHPKRGKFGRVALGLIGRG